MQEISPKNRKMGGRFRENLNSQRRLTQDGNPYETLGMPIAAAGINPGGLPFWHPLAGKWCGQTPTTDLLFLRCKSFGRFRKSV
jgi:hypothetical protein